jgi:hypothetical protein
MNNEKEKLHELAAAIKFDPDIGKILAKIQINQNLERVCSVFAQAVLGHKSASEVFANLSYLSEKPKTEAPQLEI